MHLDNFEVYKQTLARQLEAFSIYIASNKATWPCTIVSNSQKLKMKPSYTENGTSLTVIGSSCIEIYITSSVNVHVCNGVMESM